jgi:hypothetical protein
MPSPRSRGLPTYVRTYVKSDQGVSVLRETGRVRISGCLVIFLFVCLFIFLGDRGRSFVFLMKIVGKRGGVLFRNMLTPRFLVPYVFNP